MVASVRCVYGHVGPRVDKMSDNSPSVYGKDDKVIYRASAIGGCITALAAARQGHIKQEPREFQAKVYSRGDEVEEKFFADHPELDHYRQLEISLPITGRINVVGHLDAYADDTIVEVKRQANDVWKKWKWDWWEEDPLWIKYSWQVSACMLGLGWRDKLQAPLSLYRVNGETGETDEVNVFVPFWSKQQIMERILEVEERAHDEKLVCVTPNFFCDYPQLHADDKELVDDDELETLVDRYQQTKYLQDSAASTLSEIKDLIKIRLDTLGSPKVLLMSGRTITKSEYDTKDHLVKGGHSVRLTIK